jgi:hypothetical protein
MNTRTKVALSACGVFISLTVGVTTVSAIPTCQRLVHVYKEKLVRNRVSKTTQARWNAWNKIHPGFKPKPRPAYKMTTEEVIEKLALDCQIPVTPGTPPIDFGTTAIDTSAIALEPAATDTTSIDFEPMADMSTDLFPPPTLPTDSDMALQAFAPTGVSTGMLSGMPPQSVLSGASPSNPPGVSSGTSLSVAPIPEPSNIVLVLTGVFFLLASTLLRSKLKPQRLIASAFWR